MNQFSVSGASGGYADEFEWGEAVELCKEDSKEEFRVISDKEQNIVAIFYVGEMFIPVKGDGGIEPPDPTTCYNFQQYLKRYCPNGRAPRMARCLECGKVFDRNEGHACNRYSTK
jgi:hypothetical protein